MTKRSYDQTTNINRARNRQKNVSSFTPTSAISCKTAVDHLDDYLHGDAGLVDWRSWEKHFDSCLDCSTFLSTYKKTIELTRAVLSQRPETRPVNFQLRLPSSL